MATSMQDDGPRSVSCQHTIFINHESFRTIELDSDYFQDFLKEEISNIDTPSLDRIVEFIHRDKIDSYLRLLFELGLNKGTLMKPVTPSTVTP